MTSLRHKLYLQSESERSTDAMYNILFDENCDLRTKLISGVLSLIQTYSKHPAVAELSKHCTSPVVEKALILAAVHTEPDFLTYLMDMQDTCSSTLSEYVAHVLPALVEKVLNGALTMSEFVENASYAYVRL